MRRSRSPYGSRYAAVSHFSPEKRALIRARFRRSVTKTVEAKRMWEQLWGELEKVEEPVIRNRFMDKRNALQSITGRFGRGPPPLPAPSAVKGTTLNAEGQPVPLTEEQARRRRSFARKTIDHNICDVDIYNDIPGVGLHFLWDLTHAQHTVRRRIPQHPTTGTTARDYEIARLPPLTDGMPLTRDWVEKMIAEFKQERVLAYSDAFQIVRRAAATLIREPNVVPVEVPRGSNIAVVGDLHGQLDDLLMIFREAGAPDEEARILFNGDFVDRGSYSTEIVLTLFAFRALYPHRLFLNRGNHECADMNSVDGFQREVENKYDTAFYIFFNHVFACLPIAHLVSAGQQRVFVVHAGLSFRDVTIAEVNAEDRYQLVMPMNSILQDLLWSDPFDGLGRVVSRRGAGCQFGADVAARFLVKNNIHLIIRSHECEDNGFALWFENRLYTIFSASDYCGDSNNYGAFCVLSDAPAPQIRVYMARKQVLHYNDRMLRQRQNIMSRLLVRIVAKIDRIEAALLAIADRRGTPGLISRSGWCKVMQDMMGIDAPFLIIARQLGVPAAAANAVGGVFDARAWCSRFKPHPRPPRGYISHNPEEEPAELQRDLSYLLFDAGSPYREKLEALFEFFDTNKDGSITYDEFRDGVTNLMQYLGREYSDDAVEDLLHAVDVNEDGEMDFDEFFDAFAYGDVDVPRDEI